MPRSRRRIDRDNRARERCRGVIKTSLKGFMGKRQAAEIAERIQGNPVLSAKIEKDGPLRRYLWREGLKIEVRDALAEWGFADDKEKPPQLELFPPDERNIVREINMARIWVPSRNAHIQYHPDSGISGDEIDEAAAYYKSLSVGIARTATLLEQLGRLRRNKQPPRQAVA